MTSHKRVISIGLMGRRLGSDTGLNMSLTITVVLKTVPVLMRPRI
jgi:hypothetical protein